MSKHIAVDIGAESGRVIVADLAAGRLTLEEVHRFANGPVCSGGQSPLGCPPSLAGDQTGAAKSGAAHGKALSSVAVDTWGIDFALLDRRGKPWAIPVLSRPANDGGHGTGLTRCRARDLSSERRHQFMGINTLYQLLAMVEQSDPALEIAETLLMMPDLFHYWLSGRKVCEFTDAASTQFYNPLASGGRRHSWQSYGYRTIFLPEVIMPGTILGTLQPRWPKKRACTACPW